MAKTGLVLGGGGAKGSYEIGVWMALRDLELEADIAGVSGTSIGALNTALFAQQDLEMAKALWTQLTTDQVAHLDFAKIAAAFAMALMTYNNQNNMARLARYFRPEMVFKSGILTQKSVGQMINQNLNILKVLLSPLELFACCCRVHGLKAEYFSLKIPTVAPIESILMASAAIPVAFDAVKMNGYQYYDGGLCDNVPIKPLYDRGYRRFIVVDLSPNHRIATSDFPEASLSIIRPQATELFQGGIGRVLEFNPQTNTSRILAGYHDAVKCLATFPGEQRENLYEKHAAMEEAVFGSVVYLENGLDVAVHSALCQMIGQNKCVVIDVSVKMGLRAGDYDSCMLMANELFMVFPDGKRSYINLEVSGERMYVIPLQLTKNQEVRGNMAFLIPDGEKAGMLVIGDYYNHAVCGKHHYMNFVWD